MNVLILCLATWIAFTASDAKALDDSMTTEEAQVAGESLLTPDVAEALETDFAEPATLEEFTRPCAKPVDPKKVFLYLDLNASHQEALVAKKFACDRGLRFESIPSLETIYVTGVSHEQASVARTRKNFYAQSCATAPGGCDAARTKQLNDDWVAKSNAFAQTLNGHTYNPTDIFLDRVKQLSAESAKVHYFMITGHHYTYGYWGELTQGQRFYDDEASPFGSNIAGPARRYADVFSEMQVMAAWACGGVTALKAGEYTSYFPKLRLIGGYNGMAPSSIRSTNLSFLQSFLTHSDNLLASTTIAQAKSRIASLGSLYQTFAGIYLSVQDEHYLYEVVTPRTGVAGGQWTSLSGKEHCTDFLGRFPTLVQQIQAWETGAQPIPEDGDRSPLKDVYFDIQTHEECLRGRPEKWTYSSPRIGLLRFFESGVKINFAALFSPLLEHATKELRASHITKGFWSNSNLDIHAQGVLQLLGNRGLGDFIRQEPRANLLELLRRWAKVLVVQRSKGEIGTTQAVRAYRVIKKFLIELHPECTEMLAWHEAKPGYIPTLSCGY